MTFQRTLQRSLRTALALGLAGATLATPAFAQSSSSSAAISGFTFTLIDLDPSDGITAAVDFSDPAYVTVAGHSRPAGDLRQRAEQRGTVSIDSGNGQASATSLDDGVAASSHYVGGAGSNYVYAEADASKNFTLTPNTGILFSAQSTLSVAADGSIDPSAAVFMNGWIAPESNGGPRMEFFDSVGLTAPGEREYLLSAFAYTGNVAGSGRINLETSLNTYHTGPVNPVPEPASAAMLLAGLALVGGVARRKAGTR